MTLIEKAYAILKDWKGDDYIAGLGVLPKLGEVTARFGRKVMLVSMDTFLKPLTDAATESIRAAGGELTPDLVVPGAKPNAPREDVYRLVTYILQDRKSVV